MLHHFRDTALKNLRSQAVDHQAVLERLNVDKAALQLRIVVQFKRLEFVKCFCNYEVASAAYDDEHALVL